MLFRLSSGSIIEINRKFFITDTEYYNCIIDAQKGFFNPCDNSFPKSKKHYPLGGDKLHKLILKKQDF